jgi:hypothetical protein
MGEVELKPGWLQRQCRLAAKEVAKWPEWKREVMRTEVNQQRRKDRGR